MLEIGKINDKIIFQCSEDKTIGMEEITFEELKKEAISGIENFLKSKFPNKKEQKP